MDSFDLLPDSLILLIFNSLSDVKSLIRCRSVSKRFNSLVPQTESLLLQVDRVISPDSDSDSLLFTFFKSLVKSLHDLFKCDPKKLPDDPAAHALYSPAQILRLFDRIRFLQIELPAGDLKLDDGLIVKWRADFGKTLRSCVILAFRTAVPTDPGGGDADFAEGLKARVVWTISALIAASARHYLLKDVIRERVEMETLVLKDREGEGTLVMDAEGLRECRESDAAARGGECGAWDRSRTVVPCVRMRMRHAPKVQLKDGSLAEGATLVVVRPCCGKDAGVEDADMALGAFGGGVYGEAVRVLLKNRSYLLEMNSF